MSLIMLVINSPFWCFSGGQSLIYLYNTFKTTTVDQGATFKIIKRDNNIGRHDKIKEKEV